MTGLDPSHVTRSSDESTFCINCHAYTEMFGGGWGELAYPCSKPVGKGGITLEEWYSKTDRLISANPVLSATLAYYRTRLGENP
jgi:hypothetical protein